VGAPRAVLFFSSLSVTDRQTDRQRRRRREKRTLRRRDTTTPLAFSEREGCFILDRPLMIHAAQAKGLNNM
jgi:hypothetical protein